MRLLNLVFAILSVLSVALALPLQPTDDPFYAPPSGYENEADGTVLRSRELNNPIGFLVFPDRVDKAYQLLYKSTDAIGNSIASVTTVLLPKNPDYGKVLTYLIAQDSSYANCALSYEIQLGSNPEGLANQAETVFMAALLDQGYVVNIPDYEGPNAVYIVGQTEGRLTLDSVRATVNSNSITGVLSDAKTVIWGYSGGSVGGGWAASLHASYAPDVNLAGVAIGGVIPNVTAAAEYINNTPYAGFIVAAITGITQQYPDAKALADELIIPSTADEWSKAAHQCELLDLVTYLGQNVFDKYFTIGAGILTHPVVQNITNENLLGQPELLPDVPLYLYHAELDDIAPIGPVDKLVDTWCSQGIASLHYEKDIIGQHVVTAIVGSGNAFPWIVDTLNGKAPVKGCQKNLHLFSGFNPNVLKYLGYELYTWLVNVLGKPLSGPAGFGA